MLIVRLRFLVAILTTVATVFAAHGTYQEKGKAQLPPGKNILWTDPGDPSSLDFQHGIGGSDRQPVPPFTFVSEDRYGTSAKINVTDARGAAWNVKWGHEARATTFCTRLVWACGYFVEPEYFVAKGRIECVHSLKRADSRVSKDGSFVNARFQLRCDTPKLLDGVGWRWDHNPCLNRSERQRLKILMLHVSNWDATDARDSVSGPNGRVRIDTNLGIFDGNSGDERPYFFAD